ncbi:peptidoglycan editing factor PgeF [Aliidiomarina indica]|uniref:peptidoglycan editing factor PgeF n=1 Tax=Aliidiomarina indica TaxID=2749147 RepID=UPI0018901B69|nr:peptidoglycan editing factor PgeF [Aliidiomarina indica]
MKSLIAQWKVPSFVHAHTTLRDGGVSVAPYASLNLGAHVGDLPASVQRNRERVQQELHIPSPINWLAQIHSDRVVRIGADGLSDIPEADGAYTDQAGVVLTVLTADCLPVFLASDDGQELALIHCGWRGLAHGILSNAVALFKAPPASIHAWLGPCIGPNAFEVGADVLEAMTALNPNHTNAFKPSGGKYLADLAHIAHTELLSLGLKEISASKACTYTEAEKYFSYRRDGTTGRMASFLWR